MQVVWPVRDNMGFQGSGLLHLLHCSNPLTSVPSIALQRTWTPALISLGLRGYPDRSDPALPEIVAVVPPGFGPQLSGQSGADLLAPRIGTNGPGEPSLEIKARDLSQGSHTLTRGLQGWPQAS